MPFKFSDIVIGILFIGLIIGTAMMQGHLKNGPQIIMLVFGLMTLASLFARKHFKTPVLFYLLIGAMVFTNVFMLTTNLANVMNPDSGWIIDSNGVRQRVMNMTWIWGVLSGLILTPFAIFAYHKFIEPKPVLEISITLVFLVVTTVIYVQNEIL